MNSVQVRPCIIQVDLKVSSKLGINQFPNRSHPPSPKGTLMENHLEKKGWTAVPQFGGWAHTKTVPNYSRVFSRARANRQRNKSSDLRLCSVASEEELMDFPHYKSHHPLPPLHHHHHRDGAEDDEHSERRSKKSLRYLCWCVSA